jgi:hypothetical protein
VSRISENEGAGFIRKGQAQPLTVDRIGYRRREITFSRKDWDLDQLRDMLAEHEANLHALEATDRVDHGNRDLHMSMVWVLALRA